MKCSKSICISFLVLVFAGCKSTFPATKKEKREKAEWQAVVNTPATDSAIKEYWLELIGNSWEFFKRQKSNLSPQDFPDLKFLKIIKYDIDSAVFFNYEKSQSIESIVALNRNGVISCAIKNDSVVAAVYPTLLNGKWQNGEGFTVPFKPVAQKITEIFKAGGEIYLFSVYPFPESGRQPLRQFLVVYKNRNFFSIGIDGSLIRLDDELLKLKKYALQVAEKA